MKLRNYLMALSVIVAFSACKKDDDKSDDKNESKIVTKTVELKADDYKTWTYFSFEKGEIVYTENVKNDATYKSKSDWDIAFHRMDVKTNGGESGSGEAEVALVTEKGNKTTFEGLAEAPESGYKKDIAADIMVGFGDMMSGGSPEMAKSSKSEDLAKWINMKYGQSGPEYILSNNIYVVKTATGKYAKLWITSYHNADSKSGHITFTYVYQPDGSKKFK
ncbi:MAG: HmuY family protein [Bacteroidales bacterium]|jgi:hypothetical protein|nr:HmuY family protein [Bacteroidales bacterium]